LLVIPAEAGIQFWLFGSSDVEKSRIKNWIPACAGMTSY